MYAISAFSLKSRLSFCIGLEKARGSYLMHAETLQKPRLRKSAAIPLMDIANIQLGFHLLEDLSIGSLYSPHLGAGSFSATLLAG